MIQYRKEVVRIDRVSYIISSSRLPGYYLLWLKISRSTCINMTICRCNIDPCSRPVTHTQPHTHAVDAPFISDFKYCSLVNVKMIPFKVKTILSQILFCFNRFHQMCCKMWLFSFIIKSKEWNKVTVEYIPLYDILVSTGMPRKWQSSNTFRIV